MTTPGFALTAALADRYRLERELGQGGMATVYLAEDLKHDRKVAIKVLRPELAAVIGAERFVVEIKMTAALQHPHILPCPLPVRGLVPESPRSPLCDVVTNPGFDSASPKALALSNRSAGNFSSAFPSAASADLAAAPEACSIAA